MGYMTMPADMERIEQQIAPVVLLVYNRPKLLGQLLELLRTIRPGTVLVVADGPRSDMPGDKEACAEVRALIEKGINWNPRVLAEYAETNLGLRQRVASGLTWAFQQVERAIILEDDCLPHPSFFQFCTEMLERYEGDDRISAISGDNFQEAGFDCGASYYFSRYPHCWGWASWRRAWQSYDDVMTDWPRLRESGWLEDFLPERSALLWKTNFDGAYDRTIPTWYYPWAYACWRQSLISALPAVNLVKNVGFGMDATNCRKADSRLANRDVAEMKFPLVHPAKAAINETADRYYQRQYERPRHWRKGLRLWWHNFRHSH